MGDKFDTNDDIRLGKKLFRAMEEERIAVNEGKRSTKVAVYAFVFIIIACIILSLFYIAGGF